MAFFTGRSGSVVLTSNTSFEDVILHVTEFSLSIESDKYNRNIFGDSSDSLTVYRGIYRIRGTISGYLDSAVAFNEAWVQPGNTETSNAQISSTLDLYPDGNTTGKPKFTGKALLSNWRTNVNRHSGLNTFTVDFQNTNEWTMGVVA